MPLYLGNNAILKYNHLQNLAKVGEEERRKFNVQSLTHRHNTTMMKKIWNILEKLQSPVVSDSRNKACLENLKDAQACFTDFNAYTM